MAAARDKKTQTRVIAGMDVKCTPFGVLTSLELSPRVGRVVAPLMAQAQALAGAGEDGATPEAAGPALEAVLAKLDGRELVSLAKALLSETMVVRDGKALQLSDPMMIEVAFDGLGDLIAACAFSAEVNFAGFFAGKSATSVAAASARAGA